MMATLVAAERLTIRPENREGNTSLTLLPPGKARKLWFGRLNAAASVRKEEGLDLAPALHRVNACLVAAAAPRPPSERVLRGQAAIWQSEPCPGSLFSDRIRSSGCRA